LSKRFKIFAITQKKKQIFYLESLKRQKREKKIKRKRKKKKNLNKRYKKPLKSKV